MSNRDTAERIVRQYFDSKEIEHTALSDIEDNITAALGDQASQFEKQLSEKDQRIEKLKADRYCEDGLTFEKALTLAQTYLREKDREIERLQKELDRQP